MRSSFLASLIAVTLAMPAYAGEASLSFPDVLAAARKVFQSEGRAALAASWADAAQAAREPAGLWRVEIEGSAETEDTKTRVGGLAIGKTFVFGDDDEARKAEAQLESKAELEDDRATLLEFERELGAVYAAIGRDLEVRSRVDERLSTLAPVLKQAEQSTARGTGDTLGLHKARLLLLKMTAERDAAAIGATARSRLLKERLQLASESFSVQPVTASAPAKASTSPESSALRARSEALKSRETARQGLWEMDGSVGVQRDFTGKSNAVVAKLEIPLGQGAVTQREAREIQAERARLLARADAAELISTTKRDRITRELELTRATRESLVAQRDALDRLLVVSRKGMAQGLTGPAEVIETLAELFAVDVAIADADHDTQLASIELLLVNGDQP